MQFEGRRRLSHTPNLTPLIDVVFLLLVFFMLTSHFVRDESIRVDLPTAASGEESDTEPLQVAIDAAGRISLHNHFVDEVDLVPRLRELLAGQAEKVVRIRGDQQASLGVAVTVLDAARRAGAEGVDIVTEQPH